MPQTRKPKQQILDVLTPSGKWAKRKIKAHKVSWSCQECGQAQESWQYSGPAPR